MEIHKSLMRRQVCMYKGDCPGKTPNSSRFSHTETGDTRYCCIRDHCNLKERNYERIKKRLDFLGIEVPKGRYYYFCIDPNK